MRLYVGRSGTATPGTRFYRVDWLRDTGLPRLQPLAAAEGKPVPMLCPRIRLRLTDSPLPEAQRVAGEGTLDQMHADLQVLQDLDAPYVLFDTFYGDVDAIRQEVLPGAC